MKITDMDICFISLDESGEIKTKNIDLGKLEDIKTEQEFKDKIKAELESDIVDDND